MKSLYSYIVENKKGNAPTLKASCKIGTDASEANPRAKVLINIEESKEMLEKMKKQTIGVTDFDGFLTELKVCLGFANSNNLKRTQASEYGYFKLSKNGKEQQYGLRLSNHHTNCERLVNEGNDYTLALTFSRFGKRKNNKGVFNNLGRFIPHPDVLLDEFVYMNNFVQNMENPLCNIIDALIAYLNNGTYNDGLNIKSPYHHLHSPS